jgi:hypothetical protein
VPQVPDRREFIDSNNQLQSSRLIDITTQDYVLSSNGHFVGQDVIKQQIYMSLLTQFNSSAQNGLGNQFFNIKLITPNILKQAKSAVQLALANMINNGTVILNGVNVIPNGQSQIILQVFWTEVNSGAAQTTNLPLGGV